MLSSMELKSPSGLVVMVFVVQNGSQLGAGRQWQPGLQLHICALENMFVHWKYICALENKFVH